MAMQAEEDELENFIKLVEILIADVQRCQTSFRAKMVKEGNTNPEYVSALPSQLNLVDQVKDKGSESGRGSLVLESGCTSPLHGFDKENNCQPLKSPCPSPEEKISISDDEAARTPGVEGQMFFSSPRQSSMEESPAMKIWAVPLSQHGDNQGTQPDFWKTADSSHISDETSNLGSCNSQNFSENKSNCSSGSGSGQQTPDLISIKEKDEECEAPDTDISSDDSDMEEKHDHNMVGDPHVDANAKMIQTLMMDLNSDSSSCIRECSVMQLDRNIRRTLERKASSNSEGEYRREMVSPLVMKMQMQHTIPSLPLNKDSLDATSARESAGGSVRGGFTTWLPLTQRSNKRTNTKTIIVGQKKCGNPPLLNIRRRRRRLPKVFADLKISANSSFKVARPFKDEEEEMERTSKPQSIISELRSKKISIKNKASQLLVKNPSRKAYMARGYSHKLKRRTPSYSYKSAGERLQAMYRAGSLSARRSIQKISNNFSFGSKSALDLHTSNASEVEDSIDTQLLMMDRPELNYASEDSEIKQKYLIKWESRGWTWWQRLMSLCCVQSIVFSTIHLTFGEVHVEEGHWPAELIGFFFFDALFFVDFCIRFLVTFPNPNMLNDIEDYKGIANHYIFQGTAIVQVLGAFPFFVVMGLYPQKVVSVWWWLSLLRLPKMGVILAWDEGFQQVVQKRPMMYRACKMSFVFFLIMHFLACLYWHVCMMHGFSTSTSPDPDVFSDGTAVLAQYNHALFKALLVLSATDLVAENKQEELFMAIGLFVAFVVNGVLIGSFSNLFSENGTMAARKSQAQGMSNYVREMRIPRSLRKSIATYLEFQWDIGQNCYMQSMFDELPPKIKLNLELQLQKVFVEKAPLIKELPPAGVFSLIRAMQPKIAQPRELIIRQGERGQCMYFISNGTVRISIGFDLSQQTYLVTLGEGNQFGEIALTRGCRRTANCQATSFTELYEMKKEKFRYFCNTYGIFEKMMSYMAAQRLRITRSVQDAQKLKSKLGLEMEQRQPIKSKVKQGFRRMQNTVRESMMNSSKGSSFFSATGSRSKSSASFSAGPRPIVYLKKTMSNLFATVRTRNQLPVHLKEQSYENTLHPQYMQGTCTSPKANESRSSRSRQHRRKHWLFYSSINHIDDLSMSEIECNKHEDLYSGLIDFSNSFFVPKNKIRTCQLRREGTRARMDVKEFESPKFFFQQDEDVKILRKTPKSPLPSFGGGSSFGDFEICSEEDTLVQSIRSYSSTTRGKSHRQQPSPHSSSLTLFHKDNSSDDENSGSRLLCNPSKEFPC
mmetsp:Transcript_12009/g.15172  ORF Transcript_12009/g.15172 Transcript_12009/m.15172 type:complete len:1284 (-) Transcript_12009:242-4093(-)|eukprot:CAMPEP_0117751756 /NCGR_PEP_ID=MMETSP0947-20121206/11175_1 /TAXON_ID=44440 /ORGANISM="Chattonella subsalsa, Strain CCMP2191" /LENGTH=1283 /DNA_ID=CAMNT_0005570219 /DNA_START=200 /DNA_END=4051 /DNA_ORIENTATION=-